MSSRSRRTSNPAKPDHKQISFELRPPTNRQNSVFLQPSPRFQEEQQASFEGGDKLNALFDLDYSEGVVTVPLEHRSLVNNKLFHDVVISVGKTQFVAHAFVLGVRCPAILTKKELIKSSKKKGGITVLAVNPDVASAENIERILYFIYTGEVNFLPSEVDQLGGQLIQLIALAELLGLERLRWFSFHFLQTKMSIANVFLFLRESNQQQVKRAKDLAISFAVHHYEAFIKCGDGIKDLGIDLFQEVVAAGAAGGAAVEAAAAKVQDTADDRPPRTTVREDFKLMYASKLDSDLIVKIEGQDINCHKAVLANHSEILNALIQPLPQNNAVLELSGISAAGFRSFARFLYYGESRFKAMTACELIQLSERFKMDTLRRVCEQRISTSITTTSAAAVLSLTYHPSLHDRASIVETLRAKSLKFVIERYKDVSFDGVEVYRDMAVDILLGIQKAKRCQVVRNRASAVDLTASDFTM